MGPNSIRTRSRTRKGTTTRSSSKGFKIKTKQTLLSSTSSRIISHQEAVQNSPSKSSSSAANNNNNNNNNNNDDDDEFPKTEGIVFEAIDDDAIENSTVSSSPKLSVTTISSSNSSSNGCSTPKGDKFRIPEVVNCPPAPKKRRVEAPNCSVRRSPIAFFAPPDLELFFHFALRGISV